MVEQKEVKFVRDAVLIEGTIYIVSPNPDLGYNLEYSIFVPKKCENNTTLLLHCCNTDNDVPIHVKDAIEIARRSTYERPNLGMRFGNELNMPVMIPLIPRIVGYYTQALGRQVFKNDITGLIEDNAKRSVQWKLFEGESDQIREQCRDLHLQVVNMIKNAKSFLQEIGINIDDKVIIEGYSAGSKFANYFTALHPEAVKACICGGNSGLGILPLKEFDGHELLYPLGVTDIPNFDYEAFCQIPQLYYIGTEDYSDPAMIECVYQTDRDGRYVIKNGTRVPVLDKSGNVIPVFDKSGRLQPRYSDSFSREEIEIIYNCLGKNPQVRFANQEKVYSSLGINASFQRFPGDHSTISQNRTYESVKDFIKSVIVQEKKIENDPNFHNI